MRTRVGFDDVHGCTNVASAWMRRSDARRLFEFISMLRFLKRALTLLPLILKNAGLSIADINAGKILPFRRKKIELGKTVNSWEDLKKYVTA